MRLLKVKGVKLKKKEIKKKWNRGHKLIHC